MDFFWTNPDPAIVDEVHQACIEAVAASGDDNIGQATLGSQTISVPRGFGLPPGDSCTGNIAAMPMYAGESVSAIETIAPARQIIADLCDQANHLLRRGA